MSKACKLNVCGLFVLVEDQNVESKTGCLIILAIHDLLSYYNLLIDKLYIAKHPDMLNNPICQVLFFSQKDKPNKKEPDLSASDRSNTGICM